MITISRGLQNSLIVLEFLRNDEEFNNSVSLGIGTFTNCRECGLTFYVFGYYENGEYFSVPCFTWCVYEHRNTDNIIINGKVGLISLNGDLPYNGDDKWTYLKSFEYNQHYECAEALKQMINEYVAINKTKEPK